MYDTIIIGSGPAGLTAAIYACRAGLKAVLTEKEYMGTGQIAEASQVDNYPGYLHTEGFDLGERFREHAEGLGAEIIEKEALRIVPEQGYYTVEYSDGTVYDTRTIIYAAGASHRKLDIPGEAELSGRGVSYCAVCDSAFYEGKTVSVVGGGDTALGDALLLSKTSSKVYLIHRRDAFRANKTLCRLVEDTENIETVMSAVPVGILGDDKVTGLKLEKDGSELIIDTDGVFAAIGSIPNSALLKGIADLDEHGYVIAGEDGATSAEGIFAAGDVRTKPLRQVITAASDGANCLISAENYISRNSW